MDVPARINLFRNGEEISRRAGKVMLVGLNLKETLQQASLKFGEEIVEFRSLKGGVIDDVSLLRDWDTVMAVTKDVGEAELSMATVDGDSHSLHSVQSTHTSSHPSTPDIHRTDRSLCPTCRLSEPTDFVLRQTSSFPSPDACSRHDWARLNVGGRIFATTRATLTSDPDSMLARMFEPGWSSATDSSGAYLIDRSPDYFEPLLNFLRHGKLILNEGINPQGVLEEARFFGISKAIEPLELMVQNEELALSGHFTRKEFLRMLSITSSSATLRCQGINIEGVDLSNLDLRNINFKCANLRFCNLSNCDLSNCVFERADMYHANLDGAIIQCVHMPRVNMEGASLKGCSMDERLGIHTNLEGANLKAATFDNSQMNGVNLRLASLRGSSLRSCNLRYAIMAGTDMENCDLTGCELQHANLRGSNLTGAILKEIVAPLHMSQTVNVTTVSSQVDGTPAVHGHHAPLPHHHHQGAIGGQGTGAPSVSPHGQQAHPPLQQQAPSHHHHNHAGASPPHGQLQLHGEVVGGGGANVHSNNNTIGNGDGEQHIGMAQDQANHQDNT